MNSGPATQGSSVHWDRADLVLDAWLREPHADVERRLRSIRAADPDLADTIERRIGTLRRLGWLGTGADRVPQAGDEFGDYELLRLLGAGGMGSVFLARRRGEQRAVALKIVRGRLLRDPLARERFYRESRIVEKLSHPGICKVLEVGEVDDTPYFVMEFITGESLAESLRRLRHATHGAAGYDPAIDDVTTRVHVVEMVARALHFAHQAGIVHRDLKPSNVMIDSGGRPIVIDFGLAQIASDSDALVQDRQALSVGTPGYMPPEQFAVPAHAVDRRADVFALGATLFECLTLHRPFAGEPAIPSRSGQSSRPPPDPRRFAPELPTELCSVLASAMSPEPERRQATAAQFANELARFRARAASATRRRRGDTGDRGAHRQYHGPMARPPGYPCPGDPSCAWSSVPLRSSVPL